MKLTARRIRILVLILASLGVTLFAVTCTTAPKLSAGVVKRTETVDCEGTPVVVDFYFRNDGVARPGVVVAHGFTRNRRHMAGWGAVLAERGMVAAVLTQPYLAKHVRNAKAITHLAEAGRRGEWPVRLDGRMAMIGFSMGGLTTLTAASRMSAELDAWVGLDPVDFEDRGAALAAKVKAPALVLLAEPAPFNRKGNGVAMVKHYGGPMTMFKVKGANHCDPESPTDILAQLACGWVREPSHALFMETTLAFLEEELLGIQRGRQMAEGLERVSRP